MVVVRRVALHTGVLDGTMKVVSEIAGQQM